MGFMSRRVVPTCASCIFCPALRSRSRLPVKRYKKLLADVFQEELPNDKKISKLCDYASKNPLRLPKIATSLEQKGYKAIRNEQFGSLRVMVAVYIKLFSACKDQMPLFAVSAISMTKALLDQDRQDDMCVFGCTMLFEFAYNQVDGTYFYQLDALLLTLCSIAQVTGEERRQRQLRSAGLRALSALIWFMGEHSYMPSDYNCVISVIMDNYGHPFVTAHDNASAVEIPSVWAQLCVEKISQFCKEATTTRRFLEPIFVYFDMGKHWSPRRGLALTVLQQILHFVESFGNDCFLLAVLVKHLDHKNMIQEPKIKADVVSIAACLARQSKSKATAVEIGVLSDMLRHLRNTLQVSLEGSPLLKLDYNKDLQLAIQEFLAELVKKVGDLTPIFEIMALTLETLPSVAMSSRSTIHSLLIFGGILASQPALKSTHQCFPEALLHQLLLAIVHPDSDSRSGAHQVFETILISLPNPEDKKGTPVVSDTFTNAADKILSPSASAFESTNVHSRLKREAESNLDCGIPHNNRKLEKAAIILSEDQVGLLFSSLWSEANLDNNLPANYEANYLTFTLSLLFSSAKVSKHILTRAFQLSLSLRTVAIEMNGRVSPSRQRSLLMLSSAMLAFASEFYIIPGIMDHMKALLARGQIDPYLELGESGLRVKDKMDTSHYGTPADNAAASVHLDFIRKETDLSNESLVSLILSSLSASFEWELSSLREDLLQMFSPVHDGFAFGLNIQSNKGRPWAAFLHKSGSFDEAIESGDEFNSDIFCTDRPKVLTKNPVRTPSDVIGATQLLESALEIAGRIAGTTVAAAFVPFSDLATKCEDFHSNARRKAPIWANIDGCNQTLPWMSSGHIELSIQANEASERGVDSSFLVTAPQISTDKPWQILQLPPASHYDNFLRAAGC